MGDRPTLDFWYEFASTYSYLSAMRIEALAAEAGAEVRWRPFLLGPILAAQGWTTSPFNAFPVKGRHMWRDMQREAEVLGLPPIHRPDPFPQNALLPARIAILGSEESWGPAFTKAVYAAEFADGRSISDVAVITDLLERLGLDPAAILAAAATEGNKQRLKDATDEARSLGVFGAPTFIAHDGELFWGNDRLERALGWGAGRRR